MPSELKYYNLENYLFTEVHDRFHRDGKLSPFDFFCIVIWKANRAKSKVAARLMAKGSETLELAVESLTKSVFKADGSEARLRILIKGWGFLLPMATAILTVLYPENFTIYDTRVCEILREFSDLKNKTAFESIWPLYSRFVEAVRRAGNGKLSLRDCDRLLWARSFSNQLRMDIARGFGARGPDDEPS